MTPEVSVVVPVFNKAAHLRECLDSVLRQSLSSIEVICVDDGSTDQSAEILDHYASADGRVRLIRSAANRGPGAARNLGIHAASGRFLQFTDADDMLPATALEALHQRAVRDDVVVARGILAVFYPSSPERGLESANPISSYSRIAPLEQDEFWIPWWHQCYMISRQFLADEKIWFPDMIVGEDPIFLASVLVKAQHASAIDQVTYHYRWQSFESKGRVSLHHFRSYLEHAEQVKAIYWAHRQECWTRGYGPVVCGDLRAYLNVCHLSEAERRDAIADIDKLCAG